MAMNQAFIRQYFSLQLYEERNDIRDQFAVMPRCVAVSMPSSLFSLAYCNTYVGCWLAANVQQKL